MMRFISQKTEAFFMFLNRKFRINESYLDIHLESGMTDEFGLPNLPNYMASQDMTEEDEQVTIQETAKERRDRIESMRKDLSENINIHIPRLCELATSKIVDFQVRKKARQLCKKNNIDYIAWAKNQIESRNLNEANFVLV